MTTSKTQTPPPRMSLFDFQEQAVSHIEEDWRTCQSVLLVAPTGSGKTVMAAELARKRLPNYTLFLVHTKELLWQAANQMNKWTGARVGVLTSGEDPDAADQIVVATVQAMSRRCLRWAQDHFQLVILDEAHHSVASTYEKVIQHFGAFADVLGITATPDRGDRKAIGKIFGKVSYEISLPYLIRAGRLSPIMVKALPVSIDMRSLRMRGQDFDMEEAAEKLRPYLLKVVDQIADELDPFIGDRKKGLVFLPTIESALHFAQLCADNKIHAAAIWGEDKHREWKLEQFRQGKIQLLCNAQLLTEGFDEPSIDLIVPLRPTKIRPLFVQMVGRGTRTAPGKSNMLLLDFLWLHEKHKLIRAADIFSHNDEERVLANKLLNPGEETDLIDLANNAQVKRLEAMRARLMATKGRKARVVNLLDFCLEVDPELLEYEAGSDWDNQAVTDRQKDALIKFGIDPEAASCRGHASALLDRLGDRARAGLATAKQLRFLRRHKYKGDVTTLTIGEAGKWIDGRMKRLKRWSR